VPDSSASAASKEPSSRSSSIGTATSATTH
jgi:hypothetical protein